LNGSIEIICVGTAVKATSLHSLAGPIPLSTLYYVFGSTGLLGAGCGIIGGGSVGCGRLSGTSPGDGGCGVGRDGIGLISGLSAGDFDASLVFIGIFPVCFGE
jgi:hypothetical protein